MRFTCSTWAKPSPIWTSCCRAVRLCRGRKIALIGVSIIDGHIGEIIGMGDARKCNMSHCAVREHGWPDVSFYPSSWKWPTIMQNVTPVDDDFIVKEFALPSICPARIWRTRWARANISSTCIIAAISKVAENPSLIFTATVYRNTVYLYRIISTLHHYVLTWK